MNFVYLLIIIIFWYCMEKLVYTS